MSHTRRLVVVLAATVTAPSACGRAAPASVAQAEPPACTAALARPATRAVDDPEIVRLIDRARGGVARDRALEALGYRYLARARIGGGDRDYVLAEKVAGCLLARNPGHASALLLRGHVLHQMHRFREAEAIARDLVSRREFVLDLGLLGDVLMEQGRVDEAARAYQRMIDMRPGFQSYTRAAHLRWLKGDLEGAIELAGLATSAASPRDPESTAWAWSRLAAYLLQTGQLKPALRATDVALRHQPHYLAALHERGHILLALERPDEAIAALKEAAAAEPSPELLWLLADALRIRGDHSGADAVERDLVRTGEAFDRRTFALYLATRGTDADKAVALAERELAERTDVFTYDALAWALAAAGRADEAIPHIVRALSEGTRDGRLFLHAAGVHAAAGRPAEARRWIEEAEGLRHTLLPSEQHRLTDLRITTARQEN